MDDLIEGLIRLMNTRDDFVGPVNLGNPVEFTILDLAKLVISATRSKSEIVFRPLPSDDPVQRQPDIRIAKQTLDWMPGIALDAGIGKTIAYFREAASG